MTNTFQKFPFTFDAMKNILPIQILGMFGKKSLQQLVGV